MATTSVSLQEVLSAIGGPLEEQSLWALLRQTTKSLTKALQERDNVELLITPETTLLFHGGEVKFLRGISAVESTYTAPELILENGDLQKSEKSYIYSLGTTLFTAMHFELENGKEPLVSPNLNKVLLKMVEESVEGRATFTDLNEACRQQQLEHSAVEEEVNKLVTYVMGTAPELSSSEYGDTDMDDANLESEFKQAMKIQPTGSVEQLYSPSYGSRASSSLSLNSSGNRSDLYSNFHSSLPMVYCSSQERLGFKNSGRRVPRPKWSSHDRLLSPLLSADVETLASKDKKELVTPAGHTHYHTHLYTPKRTRKSGAPVVTVNVERSSSFNSTGFYRTSSDGMRRVDGERNVAGQPLPVAMTTLNLDDMPALPPQTTSDVIAPTPDTSLDVSNSFAGDDVPEGDTPPPMPYCEPPILTPYTKGHGSSSTESPPTDATFDYNDLSQNERSISSHGDNDFDFSMPDSPPPPPPPISTLPLDEQTPPTNREIPIIAPPSEEAPLTPPRTPPIEDAPPTPLTSPPREGASGDVSQVSIPSIESAESAQQIERRLTPRTALAKAFEELDKVGVNKLGDDDEEEEMHGGKLVNDEGAEERRREEGRDDIDHLYAKVDMSKKKSKELNEDEGRVDFGGERDNTEGDEEDLYAKVDMSKKKGSGESVENQREEEERERTVKADVRKAASIEDVVGADYAEVHQPKRSSMPSPAHSPTHSEPGYATIKSLSLPPAAAKPHPPTLRAEVSSSHNPCPPEGKLYEVTSNDNVGRKNQRSIKKLGVMFGPEFKNLSGFNTLNKPVSVKGRVEGGRVVPEGRRIVRVVMLNGRQVPFVVECNSLCAELFQQVLSHQSLQEKRFFGLAISKEWDEIFLEMDCKLSKYAPPTWVNTPVPPPGSKGQRPVHFNVFFRVKFYVENINDLKFAQTRHLYYLQLRKDLLEGKTYCHDQPALKMASFALQAEKGDVPSKRQPYFRMEDYVPLKVMDKVGKKTIEELLPNMHAELKGMTREGAELEFLKEAQKLPEYGMVFYRVSQTKSGSIGSVWLGFCVRGIVVYDYHKNVKTPLYYCSWKKTQNLSFSNRKFIIELQDSKPLYFYTNSYKKARYLLHLSISYHTFQLTSRGHLPQDTGAPHSESITMATGTEQETTFTGTESPSDLTSVSHDQRSHDLCQRLVVRLLKDVGKGLGINLVDLKESSEDTSPPKSTSKIVIESVVKGGPADMDGKLQRGDIVESVNGRSLAGLTRLEASDIIKNSDDVVDLLVLRDERTVVPFREPSIKELTSAIIEEPRDDSQPLATEGPGWMKGKFPNLPDGDTFLVRVKKEDGAFGLRIAGGKGKPFGGGFIYIKSLVKDTPAEQCHKLKERDIILKINGRELLDITHREVATLIVTTLSENVELVIHRPMSSLWLEASHEQYMSKQTGKQVRRREVSWSDLEPWIEQHRTQTLEPIKEKNDEIILEEVTEDSVLRDGEELPPELPNNDPPSLMEDELPSLPVSEPPSLKEDELKDLPTERENLQVDSSQDGGSMTDTNPADTTKHSETNEDEAWRQNEPLLPNQGDPSLPPQEENLLPPQDEPPRIPEGEPPLLMFDDDDVDYEESSWKREEEERRGATPLHQEDISDHSYLSVRNSYEQGGTSISFDEESSKFTSGATSEVLSKHSLTESGKDESLDLSFEEDEVFTVILKKGFRGFGFMLNKQRSLAEGGIFIGSIESDPAKSDGRLKPGDQIIEVDDESLEGLSYKDALSLLRQTEGLVELVVRRPHPQQEPVPSPPRSPLPPSDVDRIGVELRGPTDLPPLPSSPLPSEDD